MRHTEATKHKLSVMRSGKNNPFYGHKHSGETKARMAQITRNYNLTTRQYVISLRSIKMLGETECAYLAGIVDGEGSIGFVKDRPYIAIYNSSAALMEWISQNIGGNLLIGADKRGRTPGHQWAIGAAKDVYAFCNMILPFLVIKRPNAIKVIQYLEDKYGNQIQD